jgi:hypothetical protein
MGDSLFADIPEISPPGKEAMMDAGGRRLHCTTYGHPFHQGDRPIAQSKQGEMILRRCLGGGP